MATPAMISTGTTMAEVMMIFFLVLIPAFCPGNAPAAFAPGCGNGRSRFLLRDASIWYEIRRKGRFGSRVNLDNRESPAASIWIYGCLCKMIAGPRLYLAG